jgi:hypothetical protein
MFLLLLKNRLYPWDYSQTGDHINLLLFKLKKRYSTILNLDQIEKVLCPREGMRYGEDVANNSEQHIQM